MKTLVMIEYYYTNQTKPRTLAFVVPKNDEMLEEAIRIADDQNERIRRGLWKNPIRGENVYEVVDLSQQDIMQIIQAMKCYSPGPQNFGSKKSRFGISVAVHNPDLMVGNEQIKKRLITSLQEKAPLKAIAEVTLMFCTEKGCMKCKTLRNKCVYTKLRELTTEGR